MGTSIDQIRDDFSYLDDWEERYRYVIELGAELPPYPERFRDDAHKVPGCASQVWLHLDRSPDATSPIEIAGDSDAHIVRGLVAILLALYSGRTASEILAIDAEASFRELGLDQHLSSQRANGLRSMVRRIRDAAAATAA